MNIRNLLAALALCAALCAAAPALALGPMSAPPDDGGDGGEASIESYALMLEETDAAAGEASGLPTELAVVDADGAVRYRETGEGSWRVTIEVAERDHEADDAVYDLVVALPLPAGFHTDDWRIGVRQGSPGASVPVLYAGEKVRLKRNLALEASWLPILVGGEAGLPDLSDADHVWTLWDTIVRYDAEAGPYLQGFATLDYSADASVPALDPEDPRSAAYVISWVPSLDAAIAPHALRLDAVPPDEE